MKRSKMRVPEGQIISCESKRSGKDQLGRQPRSGRVFAPTSSGAVVFLTRTVGERYNEICRYNAENLAGSEYNKDREEWVELILSKRNKNHENTIR